ncbi:MAG: hypothetical protein ACWGNI_00140 [Desulfobacterales bacterium]
MDDLTFKSEEEREKALLELPDEPPPGVNIDKWQEEQFEQERKIKEASIEADSETPPKAVEEVLSAEETPPQQIQSEEEFVDFSVLGKMKKSELPEDLRHYPSPKEMLKQAAHARNYANKAEDKIRKYEERIAELEANSGKVSELQKQLDELKKASDDTQRSADATPIPSSKRTDFNNKLNQINVRIEKMKEYGGDDAEALQSVMSSTVDIFKDALAELDSVRNEYSTYRKTNESRFANLESKINNVSEMTSRAEEKRKADHEQKTAERNLEALQSEFAELKTTKPINSSSNNDDLERSIIKMAHRAYGRNPIRKVNGNYDFSDLNKFVGLFNSKDPSLLKSLEENGIDPAAYGINAKDVRNYAILMSVYWRQRGSQIDPATGSIVPLTDWRGEKVTFPDFKSAFLNMKEASGLTRAEQEKAIIDAEKNGQRNLDESLKRRDTSPQTLDPTGAPPEGQGITEEQAHEILGEIPGRMTVDEEKMERLCREGNKRGWEMFAALQKANERLGYPVPQPEPHWRNAA